MYPSLWGGWHHRVSKLSCFRCDARDLSATQRCCVSGVPQDPPAGAPCADPCLAAFASPACPSARVTLPSAKSARRASKSQRVRAGRRVSTLWLSCAHRARSYRPHGTVTVRKSPRLEGTDGQNALPVRTVKKFINVTENASNTNKMERSSTYA